MIDHEYLSTACLHGQHDYCSARVTQAGGSKLPASCKFCHAKCICDCHKPQPKDGA